MDAIACLLIAAAISLIVILFHFETTRPTNFPPGPPWIWPFIGNTLQVKKLAAECGGLHKAFEKLSEMYKKPIIGLKLGTELVVVVQTYRLVKEIHMREEFDGRPDNFFFRLRTMGTRLGITSPDGRLWHEQRSFVIRHLKNVGYGKTEMKVQIENELQELIELIDAADGRPIWPGRELLPPSILNVLWTFITSKRIGRTDPRLHKLLHMLEVRSKAFNMAGGVLSQMPWLRFIAPKKTGYALIQELNKGFYAFFMETINEHLETYSEEKADDDLIYAFIREMRSQEQNPESTFNVKQLVMIILDIFLAGATTTSITTDLALMVAMMRPDLQEKCQKEIYEVLGTDGIPNYSDHTKLPYVEAMLLEIQRFFHIVPITGPRRALKECELDGYTIPKHATIYIGLRSVHMDKEFWKDPEVFRPERFLDKNSEVKNIDRFTPFGAGHRRCLGDQLARAALFTFFVGILQKFKLKPSDKLASMECLPGITMSAKPYGIIFERR